NPNECVNCLHCQVLYQSTAKCPVCIKRERSRERLARSAGALSAALAQAPNPPTSRKEGSHERQGE
ncbi:MAG: hypothetical protein F4Y03_07745, partial [Alphaproteobacteria bacterium]|nr:hypothetical protein [Alphaproteobacteria bacterium]